MEFLIVGIGKGTYGNGGTPLTLDNLWEINEVKKDVDNDFSVAQSTQPATNDNEIPQWGQVKAAEDTGTALVLDKVSGRNYNYASPSAATTYTFSSPSINGFARCFINAASEPTVTGATKIKGAAFVASTVMEMVVESPDGVNVRYYFLEI